MPSSLSCQHKPSIKRKGHTTLPFQESPTNRLISLPVVTSHKRAVVVSTGCKPTTACQHEPSIWRKSNALHPEKNVLQTAGFPYLLLHPKDRQRLSLQVKTNLLSGEKATYPLSSWSALRIVVTSLPVRHLPQDAQYVVSTEHVICATSQHRSPVRGKHRY